MQVVEMVQVCVLVICSTVVEKQLHITKHTYRLSQLLVVLLLLVLGLLLPLLISLHPPAVAVR